MLVGMNERDVGADSAEAEIEVTPEMIEAGYIILVNSCITDDPLEADRLLVADIYRAIFPFYRLGSDRSASVGTCCKD